METGPNEMTTYMTEMQRCLKKLEEAGYSELYKVEKDRLVNIKDNKKKYKAKEIKVPNFFRFEGPSNPDDMSILYAIETCDGGKGTLIDAYGVYADEVTGRFFKDVDIQKKSPSAPLA